jgi:hypothetical protein
MARVKWLSSTPYPPPGSLPKHVGGMIWLVSGPFRARLADKTRLVIKPIGWGGGIQCVLQAIRQSTLLLCSR